MEVKVRQSSSKNGSTYLQSTSSGTPPPLFAQDVRYCTTFANIYVFCIHNTYIYVVCTRQKDKFLYADRKDLKETVLMIKKDDNDGDIRYSSVPLSVWLGMYFRLQRQRENLTHLP